MLYDVFVDFEGGYTVIVSRDDVYFGDFGDRCIGDV